jgi:hypothetical protein
MSSLSRARIVKYHMGISYHIYWDDFYRCFRVMQQWSPSLYRNSERYILVE